MTRETLTESTALVLDEAIGKLREEIMAGRPENATYYAGAIRDLAAALIDLDED